MPAMYESGDKSDVRYHQQGFGTDIDATLPPDAEMLDLRGTTGVILAINNSLNFSSNPHLNGEISQRAQRLITFSLYLTPE